MPTIAIALTQAQDVCVNVLIEPILEFSAIGTFNDGVAPVCIGDKWGVIDRTGKIVVPIEYGWINEFSEGLALANKGGHFVSNSMEDTGIAGGTWGFIDKTGKAVIPFGDDIEYYSGSFHEELAVVRKGDKWGYIDKTGKVVLPIEYDWAYDFSEGRGLVRKWVGGNPQYSFIDENGKIELVLDYFLVESFSEGLAAVSKWGGPDGKYGYIDGAGKEIIPCAYDYTTPFSEGLAMVGKISGSSQIIDAAGKVITTLDTLYWTSSKFAGGLLVVATDDWKWGVIDALGNIVVPFGLYDRINDFSEGLARVSKGLNEDGFIDKTGNVVVPLKYTIVRDFSEGIAAATIGFEKWAILELTTENPSVQKPELDAIEEIELTASVWAHEGIKSALAKGFVPQDLQNNYKNVITRAEFCRMAVKWLEHRLGKDINSILADSGVSRNLNAFSDTSDLDILAAYVLGITSGTQVPTATTPGLFAPNGQFSREQAATMIRNTCRAAGMDVSNVVTADFTDINTASSWAVDGINYVRNAGIMQGTSTNPPQFSPKPTYTREQSILTLNNIKQETNRP
jgi:hypothetical protein